MVATKIQSYINPLSMLAVIKGQLKIILNQRESSLVTSQNYCNQSFLVVTRGSSRKRSKVAPEKHEKGKYP